MPDFQSFLDEGIPFGKEQQITVKSILLFVAVFLITWLLVFLAKRVLNSLLQKRDADVGQRYAILRLTSYFLWFVGLVSAIQILGINLEGIVLGSAALLVGVGIGLQQIFNDLFSGLILLFEGKVKVGDVIDVDGMVGRVDKISVRTSDIRTLDNITVVLPNSKLISEKVINWSSNRGLARFHIPINVAYGSDVSKVKEILSSCAAEQEGVLSRPAPTVFFGSFGKSSLDFDLMFWSKEFTNVEPIKSGIRYSINKAFKDEGISIPFPQMDIRVQNVGE